MSVSFIRDRVLWAVQPLGGLYLVLWMLHPATGRTDLPHQILVGFLLGALYGIIVYRDVLQKCLSISEYNSLKKYNKVPDVYYWGNITQVLFDNR